jgi:hypothetical protein
MDAPPRFEHGNISPNIAVDHATIRIMSDHDHPNQEMRLQGRIRNISEHMLDEVKCDLAYFAPDGTFLGLDMTSFYELDEMDPGESAPFDIQLKMPLDTVRCVLNVHSKRVVQDMGGTLKDYVSRIQRVLGDGDPDGRE